MKLAKPGPGTPRGSSKPEAMRMAEPMPRGSNHRLPPGHSGHHSQRPDGGQGVAEYFAHDVAEVGVQRLEGLDGVGLVAALEVRLATRSARRGTTRAAQEDRRPGRSRRRSRLPASCRCSALRLCPSGEIPSGHSIAGQDLSLCRRSPRSPASVSVYPAMAILPRTWCPSMWRTAAAASRSG